MIGGAIGYGLATAGITSMSAAAVIGGAIAVGIGIGWAVGSGRDLGFATYLEVSNAIMDSKAPGSGTIINFIQSGVCE
jgi:hypothetical protein